MKHKNQVLKGFEILSNSIRMKFKIALTILPMLLSIQMLLFIYLENQNINKYETYIVEKYVASLAIKNFFPNKKLLLRYQNVDYRIPAIELENFLRPTILNIVGKGKMPFFYSLSIYLIYPFILSAFHQIAAKNEQGRILRGAILISVRQLKRKMLFISKRICIGPCKLPLKIETVHFLLIGGPGTGKTNVFNSVICQLINNRLPMLVYDFKGDFIPRFYRPSVDILFNPLDQRCIGWSPFNEIETVFDIDSIATSLIPMASANVDPFWVNGARNLFGGILRYLHHNNRCTNRDLWQMLTVTLFDLSKRLKSTKGCEKAYSYIQNPSSNQANGVHSTMMQYAKCFEFMKDIEGGFKISDWIQRPSGNLFISNYARIKDTLKPILSLFIDSFGKELLSLPDNRERRIFIMLDEFPTLQPLSSIENCLNIGRSKGASIWLGVQSIAQIDTAYSFNQRKSIVNACGSSIMYRVACPDTAEFLSKKIGESLKLIPEESHSLGAKHRGAGFSISKRERVESLVLASEFQGLPDLNAFLKVAGYPTAKCKFKYRKFKEFEPAFLIRDELRLSSFANETPDDSKKSKRNSNKQGIDDSAKVEKAKKAPKDAPHNNRNKNILSIEQELDDLYLSK